MHGFYQKHLKILTPDKSVPLYWELDWIVFAYIFPPQYGQLCLFPDIFRLPAFNSYFVGYGAGPKQGGVRRIQLNSQLKLLLPIQLNWEPISTVLMLIKFRASIALRAMEAIWLTMLSTNPKSHSINDFYERKVLRIKCLNFIFG